MKNLISNLANNQVVIAQREDDGAFTGKKEFYSYGAKIAEIKDNKIYLDADNWNYSNTTIKYLCQFLGVKNKKAIESGIKENEYILIKF